MLLWAAFCSSVGATVACTDPTQPKSKTLTVFAASSLSDAFLALEANFEAANPMVDVRFSFAGSHILRTQIANAAKFINSQRLRVTYMFALGKFIRVRLRIGRENQNDSDHLRLTNREVASVAASAAQSITTVFTACNSTVDAFAAQMVALEAELEALEGQARQAQNKLKDEFAQLRGSWS